MTKLVPIEFCTETISLKKNIESAFLVLAERLHRIRTEDLWQSNWSTWGEFLGELDVSESTASKLIKVHEVYVLQYKVDEKILVDAKWDTLYSVIPLIGEKKPEDVINQFSQLRREDQREIIREMKSGPCKHKWEPIQMRRCSGCGKMERV